MMDELLITDRIQRVKAGEIFSTAPKATKKMTIIFVDDEKHILDGLRRSLRSLRKDWNMRFANSAVEAITMLEAEAADVIVSDMRMPQMDGLELMKVIAERWPDSVRFILSGNAQKSEVIRTVGPVHQYLSKPCDPEVIQETLRQTFSLKLHLNQAKESKLITSFQALPAIPSVYMKVQELMKRPNFSLSEVAEEIQGDPGMSMAILKLVNSAFFGFNRDITSIDEAVSVLGLESVQALILGYNTFNTNSTSTMLAETVSRIWQHSLRVASLAKRIAREAKMDSCDVEAAFFAGLMHDIGIIINIVQIPTTYERLFIAVHNYQVPIEQAERAVLGIDHGVISAYILQLWGISDHVIAAVIEHHERPKSTDNKQALSIKNTIYIADKLDVYARSKSDHILDPQEIYNFDEEYISTIEPWMHLIPEDLNAPVAAVGGDQP